MFKSVDRDTRSAFQGRHKLHLGGVSQPAANAQPSTQALFEQIVKEMDRDDIIVIAPPPYVALAVRVEWGLSMSSMPSVEKTGIIFRSQR